MSKSRQTACFIKPSSIFCYIILEQTMILLPHLDVDEAISLSADISIAVTYNLPLPSSIKNKSTDSLIYEKSKRDTLSNCSSYTIEEALFFEKRQLILQCCCTSVVSCSRCLGNLLLISLLVCLAGPIAVDLEAIPLRCDKLDNTYYLIHYFLIFSLSIIPMILIDLQ